MHHPRGPLQQGAQLAPGPAAGIGLEQTARGQHHGDHRAGQHLTQRQRTGHGQQRDHVHAGLPPHQGAGDRHRQRHQPGRHGEGEDEVGELIRSRDAGPEATGQAGHGQGEQHHRPPA
jgi:hypothetical protein